MIAWLKGNIIHIDLSELVLDVNGVGYLVQVGQQQILKKGYQAGQEVELVIYTQVKEDGINYFGFESFNVRKVYVFLLSVNGVGPKMAMNIIDQLSSKQIITAINQADYGPFQSVSGVGKKTAQRILIDLKDKFKNETELLATGGSSLSNSDNQRIGDINENYFEDARSALKNLGFQTHQIIRSINQHHQPGMSINELIKKCLADLSQSVKF